MPRKWTNHSNSRGGGKHRFTEPTPFRLPLDLRVVDDILAMNKRIADIEKRAMSKHRKQ